MGYVNTPMPASPRPLTPQKVRAILHKAGFRASKYHRSSRIRGWGEWSPGYRVTAGTTSLIVEYVHYSNREIEASNLGRVYEALVAAGLSSATLNAGQECITIPLMPAASSAPNMPAPTPASTP